ncbi:right-handed parallel beta-helix repeat-containing protein [Neisseria shayeganii]|uniref:Right-handed parallel beta-helix repeat-containing protein n=1 Tax=Neisseria shayeganii TaxID=607712 RepID=A0A7D7NAX3_9NEIS|nr:right-handed parallel beta-helix repeat-containing protein [Neisseria shayeganii]QMT39936.1 right-handed parallel beta-helix repeat-containing protein [Neisseria shayeganii]
MAATLTIVNQHGQTLAAHRLGNTPLAIRAQDQVQYQLAGEGGMAPANVEAARTGNDLLVHIDGQQALRIEDYFLLDESGLKNPLLGMNGNGQYVAYGIVEAPSVLPVEHVLAEEVVGMAASEGASVSALTAFGIGTLALGGLALAAQSSNENNDQSNQPAPPPADNGNTTPPPSGGGNTTPPPSGGGNTTPPPSGGGNTNPPPQPPKPNGSITIEGDAKVGQTLIAKISDADGVSGSPQYQWLADGQAIANATQSTYTLTANEKGKTISVQATYTDTKNTAENPTSAATAQVTEDTPTPPANQAPTDIALSANRLPENQVGAVVGKLSTTDADANDSHTYTVNDQRFEVDVQGNLKLKDGIKVEFAQEKTISLEITTTDKAGDKYSETFTINVQDDPNYPAPNPPTPPNGGKLGVYVPKPATDFIANVKDAAYGAKGDGQSDDTAAIQKAIDAVAAKGGGIVEIPAGTYMINGAATSVLGPGDVPRTSGLQVKSNVIIRMAGDTVMQVIPNGEKHYDIFNIYNAENVAIMGGTLRGDRHSHLNAQGEWGSGIKIASAKNVVIEKVIAREFWGDAVHISDSGSLPRTPSENVTVYQLTADGNRRQGISITSADKVLIEDSAFKNTGGQGGTPPMAGIDIEPESQQQVSNVTIKNSTFDNNTGYGIALLERADVENADIRNIVIDGNTIKTGGAGIVVNNTGGHTITNNHISDIGKGWYYGSQHSLALNANSHDNTVTGNTVKTGSIIDAGQNNSVSGNTFESVAFVRGENKVGATLTAEVHNDDGAPRNLGYQWLADGKPINGATAATYTVRPEDAGKRISVEASFDKDGGARETTEYEVPTLPIAGTPNPPANDGKLGVHVPKPTTDFIANVKDAAYGAKGDGQTDDTAAIQKAIDAVAEKGGGVVEIPAGTYMINPLAHEGAYGIITTGNGLMLKSNVTVKMADDTVLKAIPNDSAYYTIFTLYKVQNAHIIGGTLLGDRDEHQDIVGLWGNGVNILSSQNVVVENVAAKNFWGLGFYVNKNSSQDPASEHITFYHVTADNNRRQGISLNGGHHVKILDSEFLNTHGHMPQSGINIEPNKGDNHVSDVEIRGNTFKHNQGFGIVISGSQYEGTSIRNVIVEDNQMYHNRDGIWVLGLQGGRIAGNTIYQPDITHGVTGGSREIRLDAKSSSVVVENNILHGGSAIANHGTNNTVSENTYKAAAYIRGQAETGEILTAHVMDGDGYDKTKLDYQWLADGKAIAGAQSERYTVRPEDSGKAISVRVTFTDNAQHHETADSLPTAPVGSLAPNHPPAFFYLQGSTIAENRSGAVVGKITPIDDPDHGDRHSYRVSDPRFEVKDGELRLKPGESVYRHRESDGKIYLSIEVTDQSGESIVREFNLNITADPAYQAPANHAPTGITLEHASVAEKNPGAIIGKVHVADPDIGDRHTFNFSDGRFEIENGYLKLKNGQQLDHDQGKSIGLSITAKDIAGASHKESFTLNIVDDGKPSGSAKMLKIQSEPELDLNNLERGTEGQEGFVIDGQGVKTLSGFNGQGGDLLQLESDAFTALDKGTLAESAFTVGGKAGSAEHRVIYNANTGELAYDPDGSGAAASTVIARLDPALELEAQHIQII